MATHTAIDELIGRFAQNPARGTAPTDFADCEALVADLGFDSLDLVEFLAQIEGTWGFTIPDEDFTLETFETVGAVRAYINARI
ncbi:phosphopantetheine-binding protein [Streptomyces sp. G-G2]|uniref:acyl carrier protein n=1 Tax=Streptomyces sp. G-G2 TaxID=3046201 RepID=UPI0024BB2878|nr:phosphopantetheine-binding protein [Streptomyces sp. G-G2]MDJ0380126.1 phosphopantetheine-binding protein [Streptomyces sp. G-G2]